MNPPLVSTWVYTRIQNCTSGSRSGGRCMTESAAHARVARHSERIHPSRQALAPRVEFIYTPTVTSFDCVFNTLCIAKRMGPGPGSGKCVDDLENPLSEPPRDPPSTALQHRPRRGETIA